MKTAIVLESWHKGNTRKLVNAIAERYPVDVYDARKVESVNLMGYDLIGFATGIYVERPGKRLTKILRDCLPEGKQTFLLYTCGAPNDRYMEPLRVIIEKKQGKVLGVYGCSGYYDLKLVRRNQGHPNEQELLGGVKFYEEISKYI